MDALEHTLRGTRTALLVVDVQNDYCDQKGSLAAAGLDVSGVASMMPRLHRLIESAHRAGVPVVFIQTIHDASTDTPAWRDRAQGRMRAVCRPGTWGSQFHQVCPAVGDTVVNKYRYSAFIKTKLELVLHAMGVETLVLAGVATNVCVESTARDACMLDYRVVLARDACASFTPAAHEMAVENIQNYFGLAASVADITSVWRQSAAARAAS